MKLSRKIVIITIAVLVLLIGGGVVYATNTPTARVERQLNLGNKYLQEGKYQEAILAFEKVIQIESKNIPARLGLGQVYMATKEYEKAETVLKEVVSFEPNNIQAREGLFKVYIVVDNLDAASNILKEISTIDQEKDIKELKTDLDSANAISQSKASYEQGIKQMNDKQYLEAIASFQKVIKEDTERYADSQTKSSVCKTSFTNVTLQKAKDATSNKDYKSALEYLEQVLKVEPNNQEALKLKSDCKEALNRQTSLVEGSNYIKLLGYKTENGELIISGQILKDSGHSTPESDQMEFYVDKNTELSFDIKTKIKCITFESEFGFRTRTLEDYLKTGGYAYSPEYLNDGRWKSDSYPTFIIKLVNGKISELEEMYRV